MPGFTLLRLYQRGVVDSLFVLNAITDFNGSRYLSSVVHGSNMQFRGSYPHGPCASFDLRNKETDYAMCFRCRSWPYDLSDFSKRTKYSVWPPRYLVDDIVKYGCHVVAIGDKHSDLFAMQWRISFSRGEKVLVWSFNHVQLKVYALLKIFLKECIECDQSIKGLLCSYFMKTIVFYAIEHSTQSLWTDENFVRCFWYCFTILLECVQTGYLPNYFVPAHNMLLSNVTGDNRIRLLRVLSRYHSLGYTCVFECPSLQSVLRTIKESRSSYPIPRDPRLLEYDEDSDVWINLQVSIHHCLDTVQSLNLTNTMFLNCANENLLDILVLHFFQSITLVSSKSLADQTRTKCNNNKAAYRQIRRHKRLLHLSSVSDICYGLLSLATFYYNAGSYHKASDVAIHVVLACQQTALLHNKDPNEEYREEICGKGYTLLQKAKRSFVIFYAVNAERYNLYPPELEVEVQMSEKTIDLPPLPYALFLLTLSNFRLGNIDQSQTILDDLMTVRTNRIYGVCYYPIIHHLVGICHQLLGNTGQAIKAFEEASRQLPDDPAATIRLHDLCMTLKQQSGSTDVERLDYCNVPHLNQIGDNIDEDMLNDYHKTMYNKDPSKLIEKTWCCDVAIKFENI